MRVIMTLAITAFFATSDNAISDDWPRCVEGTFVGEIEAVGEQLKSETRLNVHDAMVEGTYAFTYKDELVEGTLSSSALIPPLSITFRWKDKFGTGSLLVEFSGDCSEFTGKWKSDGTDVTHSWTGKKQAVRADIDAD
jgi:hypothetical protein